MSYELCLETLRDLSPINKQLHVKTLQNKPRKQTLSPGNATAIY